MNEHVMRAKMQVHAVKKMVGGIIGADGKPQGLEVIEARPVSSKGYGAHGESEDNTYALYSPSGDLSLTITNPALLGKIQPGDTFYVDFTRADS